MAVDMRVESLPEHEGPASKTWQLVMQTAMGQVTQSPPPSDSQLDVDTNTKKIPLAPAEEFIPLKGIDDTKSNDNATGDKESDEKQLKRKKSVSSDSSSEENEDEDHKVGIAPWKSCEKYPENAFGLHLEILDFYHYIAPLPEEEVMRQDVVQRISDLITSIWPAAKVEVFGSFQTRLYLPSSDIDVAVFGKWDKLPLFTLQKALISNDFAEADSIKVLDKASVPIIKLRDKRSKVHVDISFNTDSSLKSVAMVKSYIEKFPIMPYLFLTLKHFLVQRDLNEVFTGGISSYCMMLLTVSFLQRHPRLNGKKQNLNLGVLFMEFLELYGRNFNYQKIGIKIKDGGCYIKKEKLASERGNGEFPALLCIEDPVTLACDIGRSSYGILRVKEAFEYGFNVLDVALRNKYYFKVNPNSTYLSRVISISQDLYEYRRWVQKTYRPMLSTSRPVLSHFIYKGMPPHQSGERPALLPTPNHSNLYSPRLRPSSPFSPFTTNTNTVTLSPFAFFGPNTHPQQHMVLNNINNNAHGGKQTNKENRLSSVHMVQQNTNSISSVPHLPTVGYVMPGLVSSSPHVDQLIHPPPLSAYTFVRTVDSSLVGNASASKNDGGGIPVTFPYDKTASSQTNFVHTHIKRTNSQPKSREYYESRGNSNARNNSRPNTPRSSPKLNTRNPISTNFIDPVCDDQKVNRMEKHYVQYDKKSLDCTQITKGSNREGREDRNGDLTDKCSNEGSFVNLTTTANNGFSSLNDDVIIVSENKGTRWNNDDVIVEVGSSTDSSGNDD